MQQNINNGLQNLLLKDIIVKINKDKKQIY